ncbi:uncharacterized protein Tco025E_05831 [Trypanosoma conorhini]|uniref:C3H1-type domain-containing protein n=1 Tax=Trypanosoma conorhini TaxID=83891 RepID=A0A422P9Q5_9TRYP|nr:uncharacterized protein Tco025E_05831 [Trypanosoma conorhini]RNF14461.1 hypothetical protein Tco025E_05831 [Trypanosoma conorhini]
MTLTPTRQRKRNKRWLCVDVPSVEELAGVPEKELAARTLPKGFYLWFLAHHMRTIYAALSEHVCLTHGVLDYLYDYLRWGPNRVQDKLFLCASYNKSKKCSNGFLCREVHCPFSTENALEANAFNIFSNANGCPTSAEPKEKGPHPPSNVLLWHALHSRWTPSWAYPVLPSGVTFRVAMPNNPKPVEEFDSGRLFVTKVVQEHYGRLLRNEPPAVALQHCANYSKNGVCCFGPNCQFVHVVSYRGECAEADQSLDGDSTRSVGCNKRASHSTSTAQHRSSMSLTDSSGETLTTSYSMLHLSLPSSPAASATASSCVVPTQAMAPETAIPNTQLLFFPASMLQAGSSPQHGDRIQRQPQEEFQRHQFRSGLPPGNLTPFTPTSPVYLVQRAKDQPSLSVQEMYTFMLPSQEVNMNGAPPLCFMPY